MKSSISVRPQTLGFALLLASFALGSLGACNAAQNVGEHARDAAQQTGEAAQGTSEKSVQKTTDFAKEVAEGADGWLNGFLLEQRKEACEKGWGMHGQAGVWAVRIETSACVDGLMEISIDGQDEPDQPCQGGEGDTFPDQCVYRDEGGLAFFNDGPSVPNALQRFSGVVDDTHDFTQYNRLFWAAGVNHDHCYHHGHAQYGLSKDDCDDQYVTDLYAVCADESLEDEHDFFAANKCRRLAKAHYWAVKKSGEPSFNALDSAVAYPKWVPLWQQYGMAEDPTDWDSLAAADGSVWDRAFGSDGD